MSRCGIAAVAGMSVSFLPAQAFAIEIEEVPKDALKKDSGGRSPASLTSEVVGYLFGEALDSAVAYVKEGLFADTPVQKKQKAIDQYLRSFSSKERVPDAYVFDCRDGGNRFRLVPTSAAIPSECKKVGKIEAKLGRGGRCDRIYIDAQVGCILGRRGRFVSNEAKLRQLLGCEPEHEQLRISLACQKRGWID